MPASGPQVLALLRDPSTWPTWQPEILATTGPAELTPGEAVIGDASMLGFRVAGRADITGVAPEGMEQDVIVGIRMKVRYEIVEGEEGGSLLTHRLEVDLPRGVSGRVLSAFLKYRLRRMQRMLLANLERTLSPSSPG